MIGAELELHADGYLSKGTFFFTSAISIYNFINELRFK
jgi:hypothetical protein